MNRQTVTRMVTRTAWSLGILLAIGMTQNTMAQPFVGEIKFVGFNFAPTGWAKCEGQLLPIAQNQALFSLLGTLYGGDGRTTFALPDMRGRFPIGTGQGPGLTNRDIGANGGAEQVTLDVTQMPPHSHPAMASSSEASAIPPAGNVWAPLKNKAAFSPAAPDAALSPAAIGTAGGGQPHENMPPFLGVTCIIALQGIFPSQG